MADDESDPYRLLLTDLAAEHLALDAVVAPLDPADWDRPTPSPGWAVRDQIGHLYFFDGTAVRSATDAEGFVAERDELIESMTDPAELDSHTLAFARGAVPEELLAAWRTGRHDLLVALGELNGKDRLEWYGPPMSAMSFATARLMETWAHGQDVVDTVGADRPPTDRLRHIAHLGVRTRGFSYMLRGLKVPAEDVRVELNAPSGDVWDWGPAQATDRVSGDALDFCLVVTQRRHRADTDLTVEGPLAEEWIAIAQAFAGAPTTGPPPNPPSKT